MKKAMLMLATLLLLALPAWAKHPSYAEMEYIKDYAYDLDHLAGKLYRKADKYAHGYSYREKEVLYSLHELAKRAEYFCDSVRRSYKDPYYTEEAFHKLFRTYRRVAATFHYLHAYDAVSEYFYDFQGTMRQLAPYYGYYYRGRDHHGHRRHHDDGYRHDGYERQGYRGDGYGTHYHGGGLKIKIGYGKHKYD